MPLRALEELREMNEEYTQFEPCVKEAHDITRTAASSWRDSPGKLKAELDIEFDPKPAGAAAISAAVNFDYTAHIAENNPITEDDGRGHRSIQEVR